MGERRLHQQWTNTPAAVQVKKKTQTDPPVGCVSSHTNTRLVGACKHWTQPTLSWIWHTHTGKFQCPLSIRTYWHLINVLFHLIKTVSFPHFHACNFIFHVHHNNNGLAWSHVHTMFLHQSSEFSVVWIYGYLAKHSNTICLVTLQLNSII